MLIGPTLGAGLVLLLLIAESGSGFLWRDAAAGEEHPPEAVGVLRYQCPRSIAVITPPMAIAPARNASTTKAPPSRESASER